MGHVRALRMSPAQDQCQHTVDVFILTINTSSVPSSVLGALFKAVTPGCGCEKWCLVYNRHAVNT